MDDKLQTARQSLNSKMLPLSPNILHARKSSLVMANCKTSNSDKSLIAKTSRSSNSCLRIGERSFGYSNIRESIGKPLSQILKKAIRASRKRLIQNQIIDENSIPDKVSYPDYDP